MTISSTVRNNSASSANKDSAKTTLTVSQLNRQARLTIEQKFNQVWVIGELSNFARPRSGHWYFTLKDDNAQVKAAMFANRNRQVQLRPTDGQLVIIRGRVSLYEGRGDFQIIVDHMEAAGEGALRAAFDALKQKLSTEGLFSEQNKQSLPDIPQHIVVISSATGAAIRDVLAVWRRRFPLLKVTLLATEVQGAAAEPGIIEAFAKVEKLIAIDHLPPQAVLLTRGGGSLEDLWAFNLEAVARAVHKCSIPVVSAIGHEVDVTICDFVADLRGATPSAAAELMVPDHQELDILLTHTNHRLNNAWSTKQQMLNLKLRNMRLQLRNPEQILQQANQRIDELASRASNCLFTILKNYQHGISQQHQRLLSVGPQRQLERAHVALEHTRQALFRALHNQHSNRQIRLQAATRMLHSLSPLPTLGRGYAMVRESDSDKGPGQVLSHIAQIAVDDIVSTQLQDGHFKAHVFEVTSGDKTESSPANSAPTHPPKPAE